MTDADNREVLEYNGAVAPLLGGLATTFESNVAVNPNLTAGAAAFFLKAGPPIISNAADITNSILTSAISDLIQSYYSYSGNSAGSISANTPGAAANINGAAASTSVAVPSAGVAK